MPDAVTEPVSKKAREMFNKGFSAFERGQLDYAINMFFTCVQMEPRYLQARKFLRSAEIQRHKKANWGLFAKAASAMKTLPKFGSAMAMLQAGKVQQALTAAEELLMADPLNMKFIMLQAKAAEQAGMPEVAAQSLEIAREHYPDDVDLTRLLGKSYQELGRAADARRTFERLCELRPNDSEAVRALKDAMAIDSMASAGWSQAAEKGGNYRDLIKDTKQSVLLEQESKVVKSDSDTDALIADMQAKIAREPGNVNYRRALARSYAQKKMFPEAVQTLEDALAMSPGDPELDQTLGALHMQRFEHEIDLLAAAGDEAGAEARRKERDEFVFRDMGERVKRYPNDLRLRFEWGVMLFGRGVINEAIQQFQLSQKNLKYRPDSLLYLGMCFRQKQQLDLAVDQLRMAQKEILVMTDTKKRVCFELGDLLESMGRAKEAGECYKLIYQVDIGYRDIAERVERVYRPS